MVPVFPASTHSPRPSPLLLYFFFRTLSAAGKVDLSSLARQFRFTAWHVPVTRLSLRDVVLLFFFDFAVWRVKHSLFLPFHRAPPRARQAEVTRLRSLPSSTSPSPPYSLFRRRSLFPFSIVIPSFPFPKIFFF